MTDPVAAIVFVYLVTGWACAVLARIAATDQYTGGSPDWWVSNRRRRAFMLGWFLVWPAALMAAVVMYVLPAMARFLWDE